MFPPISTIPMEPEWLHKKQDAKLLEYIFKEERYDLLKQILTKENYPSFMHNIPKEKRHLFAEFED